MSRLRAAHHQTDNGTAGVNIESETPETLDAVEHGIFDVLSIKQSALQLAANAALTILRVDQASILIVYYIVCTLTNLLSWLDYYEQASWWTKTSKELSTLG